MKLLVLGGSNIQLNTVKKAKAKGITTIVSDYNETNPGKQLSDYSECVSTFDVEKTLEVAEKYQVDGILTVGTDQPVYTVACIQEAMGLPYFLDRNTALSVTNKKVMKLKFNENNLPNSRFVFIGNDFEDEVFKDFSFPVVMKPLDSQGQRGIYKLYSIADIRSHIETSLSYSRMDEVIVEEYYLSDEITVSGWVRDGKTHLLTITDRLKFELDNHIGICYGHNFKSRYFEDIYDEINDFTLRIVDVFAIENGPIYFQFLIGADGLKINEIACRIGGAYEDILIPAVTGVDILEMAIAYSLGREVDYTAVEEYSILDCHRYSSVQLFFARPGKVNKLTDLKSLPGVFSGSYNIVLNQKLDEIVNASARAGYFITFADSREELESNINRIFSQIEILDENGDNLIITYREFNETVEDWRKR